MYLNKNKKQKQNKQKTNKQTKPKKHTHTQKKTKKNVTREGFLLELMAHTASLFNSDSYLQI